MTTDERFAIKASVVCFIGGVFGLCFYSFGHESWDRDSATFRTGFWLSIGQIVWGFCLCLYCGIRTYKKQHKREEND